jgi:recombination protein RecT
MSTQNQPNTQLSTDRRATIRTLLSKQEGEIKKVLPSIMTPERFIRVAITTISKNPALLECTDISLLGCFMDAAQLGLEVDNVMGRAYLVPYKTTCTLIIGYKGLIALAYRSDKVDSIMAQVVYEHDDFSVSWGVRDILHHTPKLSNRGKPIAAWAKVHLKGSDHPTFDVMSAAEIDAIRKRSKASGNGPWVSDPMEMWRKTVLRRLSKYVPLSTDFMDAVAMEDSREDDDEGRLRAAKIVTGSASTPGMEVAGQLPPAEENLPMPTRTETREAVPASEVLKGTTTSQQQELPTDGGGEQQSEPSQEEKDSILRQEALDAAASTEATNGEIHEILKQVMSIDGITEEELFAALDRAKVKISAKTIMEMKPSFLKGIMSTKSWGALRKDILASRQPAGGS